MSQTNTANAGGVPQVEPDRLEAFETWLLTSPMVSRVFIIGLPLLGMVASVFMHLPPFATLMSGCFLLATSLVCRKAILTFTGATLRLLVTARMVLILVLAGLLFCTSRFAWAGLVSAVLLWLVSDRLLGRRALHDLWKLCRSKP